MDKEANKQQLSSITRKVMKRHGIYEVIYNETMSYGWMRGDKSRSLVNAQSGTGYLSEANQGNVQMKLDK